MYKYNCFHRLTSTSYGSGGWGNQTQPVRPAKPRRRCALYPPNLSQQVAPPPLAARAVPSRPCHRPKAKVSFGL